MSNWAQFSTEQISSIAKQGPFAAHPTERICPSCESPSLRMFFHDATGAVGSRVLFTYGWCIRCRHFASSTGPFPEGLTYSMPQAIDPLVAADLPDLLEFLDKLWDKGELPQRFGCASQPNPSSPPHQATKTPAQPANSDQS